MPRSPRLFFSILALLGLAFATGCAAPCDRYCDITADYIELCLESGSQAEWRDAGDWTTWGSSSKDEYISSCQTDLASQVDGTDSGAAISQGCENDANSYLEFTERGLCADIP